MVSFGLIIVLFAVTLLYPKISPATIGPMTTLIDSSVGERASVTHSFLTSCQVADEASVPMPLASLLHDQMLALVANGGGELDWASLGRLAAERAGLK